MAAQASESKKQICHPGEKQPVREIATRTGAHRSTTNTVTFGKKTIYLVDGGAERAARVAQLVEREAFMKSKDTSWPRVRAPVRVSDFLPSLGTLIRQLGRDTPLAHVSRTSRVCGEVNP